nr:MAG: hypothetical protein [Caudoviricetes sp.]
MALNFNQFPYNDDFNVEKNFHKILFKPGFAVQARELTQSQSIVQDQVKKFGDHIFKNHSKVSGGNVTSNLQVRFLKLNPIDQNNNEVVAANFNDKIIRNSNNNVSGKVLSYVEKTSDTSGNIISPPILIISYFTGSNFTDGELLTTSDLEFTANVIETNSEFQPSQGASSVISIDNGVYYIDGYFVNVFSQTVPISLFSNIPSARIGLSIEESIVTSDEDQTLLDPAAGSSNFQAPGADRYKIYLRLTVKPLTLDEDETFIEIVRMSVGVIQRSVYESQYSDIDNYFAKRTFDTNGNFIVNRFKIITESDPNNAEKYYLNVGPGKAYVSGFIVENQSSLKISTWKSRANTFVDQKQLYMNYGNYLFLDNVKGGFDFQNFQEVDIHCVKTANTSNSMVYDSTVAATARISNMKFEFAANNANSLSYVYQTYFIDVQDNNLATTAANTSANSVTLAQHFSNVTDAYKGAQIRINSGINEGEIVDIIGYNGSTKVATILSSRPEGTFLRTPESNCSLSLIFDVSEYESVYSDFNANTSSLIHSSSKVNGLDSGDTYFSNVGDEELIYDIGNSFIKEESIKNTTYRSWMYFSNVAIGSAMVVPNSDVTKFDFEDETLTIANAQENFICVIRNSGASSYNVGDIVPFTSNTNVTISDSGTTATISSTVLSGVYVDVYGKVLVIDGNEVNYSVKQKNLIFSNVDSIGTYNANTLVTGTANTFADTSNGQTYITNSDFNVTKQSLYVSDVKRILKIIDTQDANTAPTIEMISGSTYDVTRYYVLDNGQNDYYYDHASIKLLKNAPKPKGNILVLFDHYDHEGNGYFCLDSYFTNNKTEKEPYKNIGYYTSKRGKSYSFRDSIDFRKTRVNGTTSFVLDSYTTKPTGIAIDGTTFITDYSYYLGRKDKLIIGPDRNFVLIEGVPALAPIEPNIPDGSLVVAKLTLDPYTLNIPGEVFDPTTSSIKIETMIHKRWRMEDITSLEKRVERVEYYTNLNSLEQSATNLQIPDEFGNNRFKNGFITDDFSSFKVSDTTKTDFNSSIQPLKKRLFSTHKVENFDLAIKDTLYNFGQISDNAKAALGYTIDSRGTNSYISLPYTKVLAAIQPYATQTVNLNPFFFVTQNGNLALNPPMDQWISTSKLPDLLIVDPDTSLYLQSNTVNRLSTGDWQTISSTLINSGVSGRTTDASLKNNNSNRITDFNTFTNAQLEDFIKLLGIPPNQIAPNGFPISNNDRTTVITRLEPYRERGLRYTTTTTNFETTRYQQERLDLYGNYTAQEGLDIDATFVTDVSLNPYIRAQQIEFSADNLLANEYVKCFFDGVDVTNRIRLTNQLILTYDENNLFYKSDILGYYSGNQSVPFVVFGRVINVGTVIQENVLKTKLDVVWDIDAEKYTNGRNNPYECDIVSLNLDSAGNFSSIKSKGNIEQIIRYSGRILSKNGANNSFNIRKTYSDEETYVTSYFNNTINVFIEDFSYLLAITGVSSTTNEITLYCNNAINFANTSIENGVFSFNPRIDKLKTDESGNVSGIFYLPGNTFHTGEKPFRVDNRLGGNPGTETTFAETKFFALSLNQQKQNLNFAPDLASSPGTFKRSDQQYYDTTSYNKVVETIETAEIIRPTPTPTPTPSPTPPCPGNKPKVVQRVLLRNLRSTASIGSPFWNLWGQFPTPGNMMGIPIGGSGWTSDLFDPTIVYAAWQVPLYTWSNASFTPKLNEIGVTQNYGSGSAIFSIDNIELGCEKIPLHDPVCQTFIFYANEYPNGCFIKSIKAFFRNKPADGGLPVTCYLLGTTNGYPDGEYLSNAVATLAPKDVKVSTTPHVLDPDTYTEFEFPVPVYVKPETMYAVMLKSDTNEYTAYTAKLGDFAISSTAKNLPTDPNPTTPFRISTTPYIGSLFLSQNTITWDSDQNQDLMFVIERCLFDITQTPTVPFVVPKGLPKRKLIDDSIAALVNYDEAALRATNTLTTEDYIVDAFNITTTDLSFSVAPIQYSYRSSLYNNGNPEIETQINPVTPGKYGTATLDDIMLDDGKGERVLRANTDDSFTLFARLSSSDPAISPVISENGVTLYGIQYNINNLGIRSQDISIREGGTGYANNPIIVVNRTENSNTIIGKTDAILEAVVTGGVITGVNIIEPGSEYASTPTITILDNNRSGNANAIIEIAGETNAYGGNSVYRYITKPVTLEAGFDAGDLRVYYTAYRPLNTNIYVYYKILSRNDTQAFSDSDWQLMTTIKGATAYSKDRENFFEFVAAPGVNGIADNKLTYISKENDKIYNDFYQFSIKIVASSPDPTFVPFFKDVRGIALVPIG